MALKVGLDKLTQATPGEVEYELYRSAVIKEFEIIIEQAGKLLRKTLIGYLSSKREAQKLGYKDIFRQAAQYELLSTEEVERWLEYRDNRNDLAHDYGVALVERTLPLLPRCVEDAIALAGIIDDHADS